jgi:hypothetical protein
LLPWLAILALLALKPNRGWSAWLIWLPLACVAVGCHLLRLTARGAAANGFGEALEVFLDVPLAWGLGLAALWLVASHFGSTTRFRAFLGGVALLAGFIVFSFAATAGWGLGAEPVASLLDPRHCSATASVGAIALPLFVPLVLPAPVVAVALALCGLACRGRFRPIGLYLWLLVSLLAGWIAVSALLYGCCHVVLPGVAGYNLFLGLGLLMLAVTSATLLPFLILSSFSPFFRERLKVLLRVKSEAPSATGGPAGFGAVKPQETVLGN